LGKLLTQSLFQRKKPWEKPPLPAGQSKNAISLGLALLGAGNGMASQKPFFVENKRTAKPACIIRILTRLILSGHTFKYCFVIPI